MLGRRFWGSFTGHHEPKSKCDGNNIKRVVPKKTLCVINFKSFSKSPEAKKHVHIQGLAQNPGKIKV